MSICIEGNIGSGKSTILQRLKTDHGYKVYPEDVYLWSSEGWLADFYKNINKHAFGFQMRILQSFSQIKQTIKVAETSIIERSPLTSAEIFGHLLTVDNVISVNEYKLIRHFTNVIDLNPHHRIYIRCDPNICLDRIRKRNRTEEKSVSIDYLQKLHNMHDIYFQEGRACTVVDGNRDFEEVYKDILHIIRKSNV